MSLSLPLPYLHFSSAATPLDTSEKRRCGGGGLPCKRGLGSPSQSKSGSCLADGRVGQRRPRSLSQEALRARWCPGHTQLPVPGDKPGTECSLAQQCAVTEGSQGPEALPGSGQHVPGQTHGSGVRPPARATHGGSPVPTASPGGARPLALPLFAPFAAVSPLSKGSGACTDGLGFPAGEPGARRRTARVHFLSRRDGPLFPPCLFSPSPRREAWLHLHCEWRYEGRGLAASLGRFPSKDRLVSMRELRPPPTDSPGTFRPHLQFFPALPTAPRTPDRDWDRP